MIEIPRNDDFARNAERGGYRDGYPCVVCGRTVRSKRRAMVHMFYATHLVMDHEVADQDERGDMGLYPIGADCLRRHPELHPYVVNHVEELD